MKQIWINTLEWAPLVFIIACVLGGFAYLMQQLLVSQYETTNRKTLVIHTNCGSFTVYVDSRVQAQLVLNVMNASAVTSAVLFDGTVEIGRTNDQLVMVFV